MSSDLSRRPTRRVHGQYHPLPIWPCFQWGLPGCRVTSNTGALLPHHFTLTTQGKPFVRRYVSVALSVGSPHPRLPEALCPLKSGLSSLSGRYLANSGRIVADSSASFQIHGAPGGDRTHDPPLRRRLLYPLSYQGTFLNFSRIQSQHQSLPTLNLSQNFEAKSAKAAMYLVKNPFVLSFTRLSPSSNNP